MKDDFVVPLNGLAQGRNEFRRSAGKEFFDRFENSEILDADLSVTVSVEKSGRFTGVDCEIEGHVTVSCDRCLEDLQLSVNTGFKLSVKFGPATPGAEPGASGLETEGDREIVILPESDTDLDLSQVVYDYVCLSLPVQRVHEEGGCNPDAVKYLNSPESEIFLNKLRRMKVCFITVDEAHCICQWGYDFRPSYLQISKIREFFPDCPVLALTATATEKAIDDIQEKLCFRQKNVLKMSFARDNLAYIVRLEDDIFNGILHALQSIPGSCIIYSRSRRKCRELAEMLNGLGFSATYYHAGLPSVKKKQDRNSATPQKPEAMPP